MTASRTKSAATSPVPGIGRPGTISATARITPSSQIG